MIAICELHLLWWPLCYSRWSYVIALGWLPCRLLQRNTAVLKLSACARACGAAWWARRLACLRIQTSPGQFYLVYWPRKCYSWCKGEKIARGGTEKGRAPFCVSLTLTGLKWIWSCNCCLGKGDCCAWEFTCGERQPVCFRAMRTGLSRAQHTWVCQIWVC